MTHPIYKNFNTNRKALAELLESSPNGAIWLNRFIPLMFQNIKDANAILMKAKTGFFSSKVLTEEEHASAINDLLNLGFSNLTYTKHASGMLIFDTLNDSLGCLADAYKELKSSSKNLKISLGISYIGRDRTVIVKEKFWNDEDQRPKGHYFIDELT